MKRVRGDDGVPARSTPFALAAPPDQARLCFDAAAGTWSLWWPCGTCGGVELPLLAQFDVDELAEGVAWTVDPGACPGCRTRVKRSRPPAPTPEVWYDTVRRDWVVCASCTGAAGALTLPLAIPWCDAPMEDIHQAAADALIRATAG